MRRRRGCVCYAVSVLAILVAILVGGGQSIYGADSVLTIAGLFDIPTVDPHATLSGTAASVFMPVCEGLTQFEPGTSKIVPHLAERWEISEDQTQYTFYLRQGIVFTDGAPFNAEAVKLNIERALALGQAPSTRLRAVSSVDVLDEYTVRFNLSGPSTTFLSNVNVKAGLVSPKAIADHATDSDPWATEWFNNHLVGTGPYMLVEWIPGDRVILTRNPDYWGGWDGPHIDTIVRRTVPEYTTRKLLLETGEVDFIDNLQPDDAESLRSIPGVEIKYMPTINVGWFVFEFQDPVMWNLDLRKALSWAFPYEEANAIAGWGSQQLVGPMPDSVPGHDSTLFQYHTDLDKAAEYLAAAGYEPGELTLNLIDYTTDRNRRWYEAFYSNLQAIGVTLDREESSWGQYSPWMASQSKDRGHMFVIVHWPNFPDATEFLNLYFEGTLEDPPQFPRDYVDPQLNWLLSEAASERDPERRAHLYSEAQQFIVDQALGIWGVHFYDAIAVKDYVKGIVFTPANFGVYDFYNMYIED
jgi:peptide/nickel transport system substrate-binding protein